MGFFRRKKKEVEQTATAQVEKTPSAEKKEPLLATKQERVPDDEPVMVSAEDAPAWTDIDGTKARNLDDPEEGDTDISLPPTYKVSLEEKRANTLKAKLSKALLFVVGCGGAVTGVKLAIWALLTAGTVALLLLTGPANVGHELSVAFVGNSYFYVNDLPRLFERVTGDHVFQDSCLHSSGSILNILKTGNGMYYKWQSQNAMVGGAEYVTSNDNVVYLYDYGACSVPQLLTGQDSMLSYGNQDGHYVNDGTNPCLNDNNYLDYEKSFNYSKSWDYVVIVDQSKRMCFDDARDEALMAFNYTYAPLLSRVGATPVIVQPHAFWSNAVNMTGLTDIPTFTSMIMDGAKIYKQFLDKHLTTRFRSTKIAPVGDAYLTLWEDDEELWQKLFMDDGIHPSGYGSYLYAMVIHATIYGAVPPQSRVVTDDVMELFSLARKLHVDESAMPTKSEALTLWTTARKVAVYGHKPRSLKTVGQGQNGADGYDQADNQNADEYAEDGNYAN